MKVNQFFFNDKEAADPSFLVNAVLENSSLFTLGKIAPINKNVIFRFVRWHPELFDVVEGEKILFFKKPSRFLFKNIDFEELEEFADFLRFNVFNVGVVDITCSVNQVQNYNFITSGGEIHIETNQLPLLYTIDFGKEIPFEEYKKLSLVDVGFSDSGILDEPLD